jgi:hypothetical protein
VKRDFNIGCVRKHEDDHTSVDVWVQELTDMNEANPILLYKRQGEESQSTASKLAASDFILCVQTVTQRKFLLKFGCNSVVCLDSTHGTNQYGFNLVTLMVVDDFGEGNPVAFMICTKEDENALRCFFVAMKARLPEGTVFTASHVMTDDAPQYYNAWVSVFGPAQKLLCVWHVDRAWRRALKENVSNHEQQVEAYHMLRTLMQEVDEAAFKRHLPAVMEHLSQSTPRFSTYFGSYCSRVQEWAYCYRKGTKANTTCTSSRFTTS